MSNSPQPSLAVVLAVVLAAALALTGAACSADLTAPYRTTSPPPSGLSAALRVVRPQTVTTAPAPSIEAAGDSVVASAFLPSSACLDYAAHAGVANGDVVITVVAAAPATPRYCTLESGGAVFRVVVRPAPAGHYAVVLRERHEVAPEPAQEREIARRAVSVR